MRELQFPGTAWGPDDPRVHERDWGRWQPRDFYRTLREWAAGINIPTIDPGRIPLLMNFIGQHPMLDYQPDLKGRLLKRFFGMLRPGGGARELGGGLPGWFRDIYPRLSGRRNPVGGGYTVPNPVMALEAIMKSGIPAYSQADVPTEQELWGQTIGAPLEGLLRSGAGIGGTDVNDFMRWKGIPSVSWTGWTEAQKAIAPDLLDALTRMKDMEDARRLLASRRKRAMGGREGRDFGALSDALAGGFGLFPGMKDILPQMVYGAFNTLMTPPTTGAEGMTGGMGGGSLEQMLRELLGGMGGQAGGMDWWEMMRGLLGSPYGYAGRWQ